MYFLSKMSAYRKSFDETKHISFLIKAMNYYKHTMKFGKKLKIMSKKEKEFDNEPVYNEKYLKAKTKFYNGKIKFSQ